ncbi:MAG: cyclase family protein [Candidatus Binataceae bacterium]|nr:cyclase family protein [Candidatus Binataceae bacterium]
MAKAGRGKSGSQGKGKAAGIAAPGKRKMIATGKASKSKASARPAPIAAKKPAPKIAAKAAARAQPKARAIARPRAKAHATAAAAAIRPRAPEPNLPRHDQLPTRAGAPAGAAWGVFGDDDQLGTINLMTPAAVVEAAGSIRNGRVFSLNLPFNIPDPPLFGRGKHVHTIKQYASYILDDYLDNFYPQASSQWDALCHVKHPKLGAYNGIPDREITGYGGTKLGIDNLARRGIAGRGVLVDIGRYHEKRGRKLNFMTNDLIPFEELLGALEEQKTTIRAGDVLLVRIGWTKAYLAMSPEEKAALATQTKSPGIEGTPRVARWLWDSRIAAAASDSPALEAMPPPPIGDQPASRDLLHFHLLSFFGMPIGEMWDLESLADDCARDGRYDFFITSAPLNIPGGVGSPPNALAIK